MGNLEDRREKVNKLTGTRTSPSFIGGSFPLLHGDLLHSPNSVPDAHLGRSDLKYSKINDNGRHRGLIEQVRGRSKEQQR